MRAGHRRLPVSSGIDKNAAYPEASGASQAEMIVPKDCKLRRVKYLNHVIEQDHRFVNIEAMNMIRKGQVKRLTGSDAQGQAKFVASLFQLAA